MKTAIVTGAAQRLGKDLAICLSQLGYFVWIHYNQSFEMADKTVKEIKQLGGNAEPVQADLRIRENVVKMVSEISNKTSEIKVLINNVGIYETGNLLELPIQHFENIIQSNLIGCYYVSQLLQPKLSTGGSIINIGYTGLGSMSVPFSTAYSISKTGILILTKSYATLLGPRNINVNMISPGQQENSVDLPAQIKDFIPINRPGTGKDITDLMKYLISPEGSYITGQNIEVSGGFMQEIKSHLGK